MYVGMSFGAQLKYARKKLGLSRQELGNRAGVSISQIQGLENDSWDPKLSTISKLIRELHYQFDLEDERGFIVSLSGRKRR